MRYLIPRLSHPRRDVRALLLATVTLPLALACGEQDTLPTVPRSPAAPHAAITGAEVTDVGFAVIAINESGQVAGTQNGHATVWTPGGAVQDLGTLGGPSSQAYAINESGQVVGASTTTAGDTHAFLWTPGQGMQDLGTLGGTSSTARGINDLGHVVGDSYLPSGGRHAFLWTPSHRMQDLGALGGPWELTQSIAYDINNAAQVVGESFHPDIGEMASHGFLWTAGQGMQPLGSLRGGPSGSIPSAINDAGQVVGRSWTSAGPFHAFLWTQSEGMRDLGTYMSFNSAATGINEAGQVIGIGDRGPGLAPTSAFLWTAAEGMEGIWPTTGIGYPRDINDRLQVVGASRVATLQLQAGSRPPVASIGGPYAGTEGSVVTLALSTNDPDGDVVSSRWDLGDGTTGWAPEYIGLVLKHVYRDDGVYTVTLTVTDTKGNTDTKTTTATITNVAPAIPTGGLTAPSVPIQLVAATAAASIGLAFTDPAGDRDTYAAEIQCGNGTTLSPNNIASPSSATCVYERAGVYTVRASVTDEDGGTSPSAFHRYVIVYDPAGGFTTGNGFYDVPGHGNRKAHFTFDARFPVHGTVPNGTVKLWIPGGEMNFESTAIEMLVVCGNRAQFWGTGTLNGTPARFRVTVVDGQASGNDGSMDAIRIEVWDAGGAPLLYDTQSGAAQDAPVTTPVDGGNVRIRAR